QLSQLLEQDTATQQRYIELGITAEKTQVLGNIKFDITAPQSFVEHAANLKQEWQLAGRKIMILASTHAPEEKEILSALKSALDSNPKLLCIVVPRHPERFDEVFQAARSEERRVGKQWRSW